MTLNTGIFDVSDPQNPDRVYSAALLSRILSKHIRDGIVHGDGDEMAVTATDPPAMTVRVGTGTAMVRGRFCENDAALTLAVPTAHATYPRIDRVVVRLNASPGRVIDIVVKPGTAAPGPAAPALTRTAEIWELSLAQVRVEAGATSILSEKITDERGNVNLCGVACPAYVPSSQLEVVGAVDMQGKALTGLPAPSGSTDAARKGYVDSELAAKIGGFGISQIAIDANKNWGGKSITNVNSVNAVTLYGEKIYTAYTVAASANNLVTFPNRAVSSGEGLVRIVHFIVGRACQGTSNTLRVSGYVASGGYISTIQVKHNSTTVLNNTNVKNEAFSVDLSGVKADDVIEIYMSTASSTNTASQLALKGDATVLVYPDVGTTL